MWHFTNSAGGASQPWLRAGRCALLVVLAATTFATAARAAETIDPVESAGEALRDADHLPWYDATSDDLKALPLPARDAPPSRPDKGTLVEPSPNQGEMRARRTTLGLGSMLLVLGVIGIGAVFVVLIAFLVSALLGGSTRTSNRETNRITATQIDRLEELPLPLKRTESDLLGAARRHFELGDYNEAIIYFYSYLLVELDTANRIRLVRGKTNRQYLGELRDAPELQQMVGQTMIAFEDVYFGERQLSREQFSACFDQLDQFHQQLELAPV